MLLLDNNTGIISFKTEEQITIVELSIFLSNLSRSYASIHTLHELINQFEHPSELSGLGKSEKQLREEIQKIIRMKMKAEDSTIEMVKNQLTGAFRVLRVHSINLNSPGILHSLAISIL